MFYVEDNGQIVLFDESRANLENTIQFMPQYQDLEIQETSRPIVDFEFADTEDYIRRKQIAERQRLDNLTLTPTDVERALFDAKGWDFDDLKSFIVENMPTVNIKRLAIEFRSKDFYRGAPLGNMRLFDVIGALLGYTSADMDYLFEHKRLPDGERGEDE